MSAFDLDRIAGLVTADILTGLGHLPARMRCSCHEVVLDCCPTHVSGILEAGATRLGLHAAGGAPASLAAVIDHTLLRPDATVADIMRLCDEAIEFGFATVCVNPTWVASAARRLSGMRPRVCAVAGFPFGASMPDVKQYEARRAIYDGAGEIDMVLNLGALKSGECGLAGRDMLAVVEACREQGVVSKVILETALLTDEETVAACTLAKWSGADYVKTSTGFGPAGATLADVRLMRRVVGDTMGVKAAGGIRDYSTAQAMLAAGATRIGASASVSIVRAEPAGPARVAAASADLSRSGATRDSRTASYGQEP